MPGLVCSGVGLLFVGSRIPLSASSLAMREGYVCDLLYVFQLALSALCVCVVCVGVCAFPACRASGVWVGAVHE